MLMNFDYLQVHNDIYIMHHLIVENVDYNSQLTSCNFCCATTFAQTKTMLDFDAHLIRIERNIIDIMDVDTDVKKLHDRRFGLVKWMIYTHGGSFLITMHVKVVRQPLFDIILSVSIR